MRDMLMELLTIVIQIVIVGVGGLIIGWIKEKIGETNYTKAFNVAKTTVEAVEQQFGELVGAERKRKAIALIQERLGSKLSYEEIETLIEAAVFEMNLLVKPKE